MKKNQKNNFLILFLLVAVITTGTYCTKKQDGSVAGSTTTPGSAKITNVIFSPLSVYTNTSTQQETGFEDGTISPFHTCNTQSPASGGPFTLNGAKCMKFYWTQTGYDGTRNDRGAEACSDLNFYKEGWYGFHFYLSSTEYPTNKSATIAQLFCNGGCSSWGAMLEVRNDALWLVYRGNCSSTGNTETQITGGIQRDHWKDVIIHFVASNNGNGLLEVWYAGAGKNTPTYRATNINFGFGTWVNDTLDANSPIGLKFGMYNWDTGNYTTNETRTIYFDDVSQLVGNPANAWDTVNPNM